MQERKRVERMVPPMGTTSPGKVSPIARHFTGGLNLIYWLNDDSGWRLAFDPAFNRIFSLRQ